MLAEYISLLKGKRETLESIFETHVAGVGNDLLQMVQNRVQLTGKGADGAAFKDYTEEYQKRKEAEGKYKGVVDYTRTTRLWSDIQQRTQQVSRAGRMYKLTMGPSTAENIEKFKAMTKRDGQMPTKPSEDEITIAKENLVMNIRLDLFGQ